MYTITGCAPGTSVSEGRIRLNCPGLGTMGHCTVFMLAGLGMHEHECGRQKVETLSTRLVTFNSIFRRTGCMRNESTITITSQKPGVA